MTAEDFQTEIYGYYYQVAADTTQEPDHLARILHHMRRGRERIWIYRPWVWSLTDGTVTLTINQADAPLPDNYYSRGPYMKVFLQGQRHEVIYAHPRDFAVLTQRSPRTGNRPIRYTIYGQAYDAGDDAVYQRVRVWPTPSVAGLILDIRQYKYTLTDFDPLALDTSEQMDEIPDHYQRTLLWEYVVQQLKHDDGDARVQESQQAFVQMLAEAWREENPSLHTPGRTPPYMGRQ